MNQRRVILLLIAALLVVGGAVWLSSQRHLERDVAAGQAVMPDLKKALNDVTEVRIAKGDGRHTTLRKSGEDWVVAERNFAADASRVRKLLLDIGALEIIEEKTSDPQRYGDIWVQDIKPADQTAPVLAQPKKEQPDFTHSGTGTRIDVMAPGKTWSLITGRGSGGKGGYIRVVGVKRSLLATPRLDPDSEPKQWLDKTIVDIPQARIQKVAVTPAKGPAYSVSREKREQENFTVSNIPKGRKLSSDSSGNSLASGLESVSLDDVHPQNQPPPKATGATVEPSHVTYRTFDGVTVEVSGRKESAPGLKKEDPKEEKFYITLHATSSDKATQAEAQKLDTRVGGREFEVSSWKYEGLFKPIDDLLEALPEKPEKKAK